MADLPEHGTFKIATIGPLKKIPKKDNPRESWVTWSLQFAGDPSWYDTFWPKPEDPTEGMPLTGTKSNHEKFGLQFAIDRQPGGKSNWNPAAAQATVMAASIELVNGFLVLGDHFDKWKANDPSLKAEFNKYVSTVVAASKQVKNAVVDMGSIAGEGAAQKSTEAANTGDPGPQAPPEVSTYPGDEEDVPI